MKFVGHVVAGNVIAAPGFSSFGDAPEGIQLFVLQADPGVAFVGLAFLNR